MDRASSAYPVGKDSAQQTAFPRRRRPYHRCAAPSVVESDNGHDGPRPRCRGYGRGLERRPAAPVRSISCARPPGPREEPVRPQPCHRGPRRSSSRHRHRRSDLGTSRARCTLHRGCGLTGHPCPPRRSDRPPGPYCGCRGRRRGAPTGRGVAGVRRPTPRRCRCPTRGAARGNVGRRCRGVARRVSGRSTIAVRWPGSIR